MDGDEANTTCSRVLLYMSGMSISILVTRQLTRKGLQCGETPDKVELLRQNQTRAIYATEALLKIV